MQRYWPLYLNIVGPCSAFFFGYFVYFFFLLNVEFLQLGGLNSMLVIERSTMIPLVSKVPTIILGMDVSHGSPGQSDIPSIAAVS